MFIEGLDVIIPTETIALLPTEPRNGVLTYAYRHKVTGNYILCGDNARFLNHSFNPNLVADDSGGENDVAVRNITAGEELTVDYSQFDDDFDYKINLSTQHRQ